MPDKSLDKKCFIICPLGEADSEERRITDDLCKNVIKPALNFCDYTTVIRIDERAGLEGYITDKIKEEIKSAYLVIADLRGLNENVMYELGYRHAINEKCILLVDQHTKVPFDINQYQHFVYSVEKDSTINSESRRKTKEFIVEAIKNLEETPTKNSLPKAKQPTYIDEFHEGRDIHYEISLDILHDDLSNKITKIFILQRSSTLILGPKSDSDNEFILHMRLSNLIKEKDIEFYHVTSLDGLKKDISMRDAQNEYSQIKTARNNLDIIGNEKLVGILGFEGKCYPFRQLSRQYDVDNQVRFLIVEREDKSSKAIVVFKYGNSNCSIKISGPIATALLRYGLVLYEKCRPLTWSELCNIIEDLIK
jgi:hypothetical protein